MTGCWSEQGSDNSRTRDAMSERGIEQSLFGAEHVVCADHDRRNIVAPASFEGHLDQHLGGLPTIACAHGAADFLFAQLITQSVAAQQEDVAVADLLDPFIEIQDIGGPYCASDPVLSWAREDICGDEMAAGLELLQHAVIARQQLQASASVEINSTVSGPEVPTMAVARKQDDDGASDPLYIACRRLGSQFLIHGLQPLPCSGDEALGAVGRRSGAQSLDDPAAREVADGVPAHAVGHSPEPQLGSVEASILVYLTDQTHVGTRGRRPPKLLARVTRACVICVGAFHPHGSFRPVYCLMF